MIHFACPSCGRSYDASTSGVKFNCNSCGQRLQVPEALAESSLSPRRTRSLILLICFLGVLILVIPLWAILQVGSSHPEKDNQKPVEPGTGISAKEKKDDPSRNNEVVPPIETRERLIEAFDALGASEELDKIKGVRIHGKAHFVSAGNVNDLTAAWQSLRKMKYSEKNPLVAEFGVVLKADDGWYYSGLNQRELKEAGLAFYQNFAYSLALSNLLPLKEKGFELAKEKNILIRGRDCYSVRVKSKGRPEMVLFFDQKTNLLSKSEFTGPFMMVGTLELQKENTFVENYFSNYRKAHQINHWWKWEQFRDGRKYGEINLYNIEFFEKVDEKLFSFP